MKNIYITGDRRMHPGAALVVIGKLIIETIVENGEDVNFITGTETGVEAVVREMVPAKQLTVVERSQTPEGYTDFDTFHKEIADKIDRAIIIHTDPLVSRIGKSASENIDELKVSFLLQDAS